MQKYLYLILKHKSYPGLVKFIDSDGVIGAAAEDEDEDEDDDDLGHDEL